MKFEDLGENFVSNRLFKFGKFMFIRLMATLRCLHLLNVKSFFSWSKVTITLEISPYLNCLTFVSLSFFRRSILISVRYVINIIFPYYKTYKVVVCSINLVINTR